MSRRVRLVRLALGYAGGLVLHTATSGSVPGLDEIRLVIEEDGVLVGLGSTRTNIAYLTGLPAGAIEDAILDAAGAVDWSAGWDALVDGLDARRPALVAPARMLFETAAQDGAARRDGVTLAERLGAAAPVQGTSTNQTLFWSDDATLLRRAEAYVARGFTELKLRIAVGSFADDLRRLRLLRDRFGDEVRLSADANGLWRPADAPARLEELARLGLEYLEQPLPADAWHGTAQLAAASPVPIMLDEALDSMTAVRRLVETGAAPLAHLKLAKLGGVDRAVEAARLLAGAGIGIMLGQMNEGAVSTAAAAHLATALDAPLRELYGADGITGEVASPSLRYEAGALHLPAGPGIGLARHPIPADAATIWDTTA